MGIYIFDGAARAAWLPPLTTPVLADFAWVTQGTGTATEQYGGITLYEPGHGTAASLRILKKAAPATPYVITAGLVPSLWVANKTYCHFGLCFRQSSDGKVHTFGILPVNTANYDPPFKSAKWTSDTAYSTEYNSTAFHFTSIIWLRIADDGANRICSLSGDGFTWQAVHTIGRTDFLTANEVGFYVDAWNTGTPNMDVALHLIHWEES